MTANKITEKRLRNKRFFRTEESIRKAYLIFRETISPERLIREAHISRSTLYRHHKNIYEIVPNYEAYVISRYTKFAKRLIKIRYLHLKDIYEQTLIFIVKHQDTVNFLMQCSDRNIIENFLCILKPKILATGKVPDGEILDIYIKEIATIIMTWQRSGPHKSEIPIALDKIIYLTNTAHTRLGPLVNFDHSAKKNHP